MICATVNNITILIGLILCINATNTSSTMSNVTGFSHYQSQAAGYFSLGNVSKRHTVEKAQIMMAQAPQINADCSGIDMHLGGVGYIQAEAFIQLLKNIGSSVSAYAFLLALETVTPMIAGQLKKLQDVVQQINMANLNSCEAAAALVGAVAPRAASLKKHACKLMAGQNGKITDWVAGERKCGEFNKEQEDMLNKGADKNKDTVFGRVNLAWFVLGKHVGWSNELKETVMSVTGTVIVESNGKTQTYPPRALDEEFLDAFIRGGKTKVYRCKDHNRCMVLQTTEREINEESSHSAQVRNQIISMEKKIFKDEALSLEEKMMVEESQIPILKIINIMSAYNKGTSPITIEMYANLIAQDLLLRHINNLLEVVEHLIEQLKDAQIDINQLKAYLVQVRNVREKISQKTFENLGRSRQIFEIIDRTAMLEKSIYANMRSVVAE